MFTVEAGFQLAKSSNQLYVKFTTLLRGWPFIFCAFPVRKTQRHLLNKLIALQMRSWVRSSGEKISPHPDISLVWIKLYKIYTFLVKRACVHLQIIQMMEKLTLTAPKKTTARRSADSSLLRCTVRTVKPKKDDGTSFCGFIVAQMHSPHSQTAKWPDAFVSDMARMIATSCRCKKVCPIPQWLGMSCHVHTLW